MTLGDTHAPPTRALFGSLVYQTVILSAASYLAWYSLMRVYLASRLGVFSLMTPVFAIGFGKATLGDRVTPEFLASAVLILFGIILVSERDVLVGPRRGRRLGRASDGRPGQADRPGS